MALACVELSMDRTLSTNNGADWSLRLPSLRLPSLRLQVWNFLTSSLHYLKIHSFHFITN